MNTRYRAVTNVGPLALLAVVIATPVLAQAEDPQAPSRDRVTRPPLERPSTRQRPPAADLEARPSLQDRFRHLLEAVTLETELSDLRRRRADESFVGVIGSVHLPGGTEVALERRKVHTAQGLQSLLLTRIGSEYVYDGDMVVPLSSIQLAPPPSRQAPVFAAGIHGTFGPGSLWDDGLLPYEVADDFCCRPELNRAIEDIEARTPFRFEDHDGQTSFLRFVNTEPPLTSRTQLGKQYGKNTVHIARGSSMGNIQHELGHELSLIHEHLRRDRDRHIARNPGCAPADTVQTIIEGWIDFTNVAFTDTRAAALTGYDFASVMHYRFRLDIDGDGSEDCSTWVRIATCPDDDPTHADCQSDFGSGRLTDDDIAGLRAIYPGLNWEGAERQEYTNDNVRHLGMRVGECVLRPLGQAGECDRERVAEAFCELHGYDNGFVENTTLLPGFHSRYHVNEGWQKWSWDNFVISRLVCEHFTATRRQVEAGALEEREFSGNAVRVRFGENRRFIDRCLWPLDTPDRCSEGSLRSIADAFCRGEEYSRSSSFEVHPEPHGPPIAGYHPNEQEFREEWMVGLDRFTTVTCVR